MLQACVGCLPLKLFLSLQCSWPFPMNLSKSLTKPRMGSLCLACWQSHLLCWMPMCLWRKGRREENILSLMEISLKRVSNVDPATVKGLSLRKSHGRIWRSLPTWLYFGRGKERAVISVASKQWIFFGHINTTENAAVLQKKMLEMFQLSRFLF